MLLNGGYGIVNKQKRIIINWMDFLEDLQIYEEAMYNAYLLITKKQTLDDVYEDAYLWFRLWQIVDEAVKIDDDANSTTYPNESISTPPLSFSYLNYYNYYPLALLYDLFDT